MAGVCEIDTKALVKGEIQPRKCTVPHITSDLTMGILLGKGVGIFNLMFEKATPGFMSEVNDELEQLTGQKIPSRIRLRIDSEMKDLMDWVKHEYMSLRNVCDNKTLIHDYLCSNLSKHIMTALRLLNHPTYAESVLNLFILVASLHIIFIQEMAVMDPGVTDPLTSHYITFMFDRAEKYAHHVERCYESIVKKRREMITEVEMLREVVDESSSRLFVLYTTHWKDRFIKSSYSDDYVAKKGLDWANGTIKDLLNRSDGLRTQHVRKVVDQLRKNLNSPVVTMATWRKRIRDFPLPIKPFKKLKPATTPKTTPKEPEKSKATPAAATPAAATPAAAAAATPAAAASAAASASAAAASSSTKKKKKKKNKKKK